MNNHHSILKSKSKEREERTRDRRGMERGPGLVGRAVAITRGPLEIGRWRGRKCNGLLWPRPARLGSRALVQERDWSPVTFFHLHTIITGCKYFHTLCVRTKYVNHPILICWRIPSKKQQLRSFLLSKLGGLSPATFLFCEILIEQTLNLSFCSCFSLW